MRHTLEQIPQHSEQDAEGAATLSPLSSGQHLPHPAGYGTNRPIEQ